MIARSFLTLHALYLINIELFMKVKLSATKCSGKNIVLSSQESLGFILCRHCVPLAAYFTVWSSLPYLFSPLGWAMRHTSERAWLSQLDGSMDIDMLIIHFAVRSMWTVHSALGIHRRGE